MVKRNNRNGQMWVRRTGTKPKQLPKALQGGGRMYLPIHKVQSVEVTIEKSCRSDMSVKEKVEFIKKHGKEAFLEFPL